MAGSLGFWDIHTNKCSSPQITQRCLGCVLTNEHYNTAFQKSKGGFLPATQEAEAAGSRVEGQPGQLSKIVSQNKVLEKNQECSSVAEHFLIVGSITGTKNKNKTKQKPYRKKKSKIK